eukprot:84357-Amphidinium_carterae.4
MDSWLCSTMSGQAFAWAAQRRKSGQAQGQKCLECATVAQQGFPLESWDSLVTKIAASAETKALWDQAVKTYALKAKELLRFNLEDFSTSTQISYRCERPCDLWETSDLEAKFPGVTLKDIEKAGLPVETIIDERGNERKGLLVACGPRKIILEGRVSNEHTQFLQHHSMQLRPDQSKDVCKWFREDEAKTRVGFKKELTEHIINSSVQKILEEKKAEAVRQELATTAEDAAAPPAEAQTPAEEESEDDVEEVGNSPNALLSAAPSAAAQADKKKKGGKGGKGPKGRGKGTGRGRAIGGATGRGAKQKGIEKGQTLTQAHAESVKLESGSVAAESMAGRSSNSSRGTAEDMIAESCQKYIHALDISKLLQGLKQKDHLGEAEHHARQRVKFLNKQEDSRHVQEEHWEFCRRKKGTCCTCIFASTVLLSKFLSGVLDGQVTGWTVSVHSENGRV